MLLNQLVDAHREIFLRDANHVRHLMPHRVHRVMRFMAVKRPVARRLAVNSMARI
jgi:hypothetical protein